MVAILSESVRLTLTAEDVSGLQWTSGERAAAQGGRGQVVVRDL